MNFNEFKGYANDAGNSLNQYTRDTESKCNAKKTLSLTKLTAAATSFATTATTEPEIKAALLKGTQEMLEAVQAEGAVNSFKRKYTDSFNQLIKNLSKYPAAVVEFKKRMETIKLEVVIESSRMKKAFVAASRKHNVNISISEIDVFLAQIKLLNFWETTTAKKNSLLSLFDKMVEAQAWFWNKKIYHDADTVRSDLASREKSAFSSLLDDAITFTNDAERLQAAILWPVDQTTPLLTKLREAINGMNQALGLDEYRASITDARHRAQRASDKLLEKYKQLPNHDTGIDAELAETEIPQEIDWINATFLAGKWVYNNLGEKIGEELNIEQEKKFSKDLLKDKTYSKSFSLPIPTGPIAVLLTADLTFEATFKASASIGGSLKLHNFLSAKESRYVSGSLTGTFDLSASLALGLKITILHIASATGSMVLVGVSNLAINASAEFNKGDESNLAAFEAKSDGKILLELKGHLELKLELTKVLKYIVKKVTNVEAQKVYTTDSVTFIRATRSANLEFKLPFNSSNIIIPDDNFKFDGGRWEVSYPASDALKAKIYTEIFGDNNKKLAAAQELLKGGALSVDEKTTLMNEYAPALLAT